MTSSMSTRSRYGCAASAGVSGLMARPALLPAARMASITAAGSSSASRWKTTTSLPASANASTYCSGRLIIRWLWYGSWECGRTASTTTGPMVRLRTKWPSMTSRWIESTPPASARAHLLAQAREVGVQDAGADLRWRGRSSAPRPGFASAPRRRGRQVASGQLGVELATGRLDLAAARVADGDGDAGGAQHAREGGDARRRRAAPARAGGRVQRDEVDVAPPAGRQRRQALGLLAGCRSCRRSSRTRGSPGGPSAPANRRPAAVSTSSGHLRLMRHQLVAQRVGRRRGG